MRIHHVGYLTKDLMVSQREFLNLGFSIEQEMAFDTYRQVYIAFLRNGSYRVELIEPRGGGKKIPHCILCSRNIKILRIIFVI